MTEVERILDQLDRAYGGGAWHGPALVELLKDVDAASAAEHPVPGAHSIAELVRHLVAWQDEAARRLEGKGTDDLPPEEDWPDVGDWKSLVSRLESSYRGLRGTIALLDDARLDDAVPGHPGTVYALLHGIVQHDLYHAGQIAILKKSLV